jgi:hypothetical protein
MCEKKKSYTKSRQDLIFFTFLKMKCCPFEISTAHIWFVMKLEKVYMKMADNYFVACRCQWIE